jgi:hypothetical protein
MTVPPRGRKQLSMGDAPPERRAVLRRVVHPDTGEVLDEGVALFFPGAFSAFPHFLSLDSLTSSVQQPRPLSAPNSSVHTGRAACWHAVPLAFIGDFHPFSSTTLHCIFLVSFAARCQFVAARRISVLVACPLAVGSSSGSSTPRPPPSPNFFSMRCAMQQTSLPNGPIVLIARELSPGRFSKLSREAESGRLQSGP